MLGKYRYDGTEPFRIKKASTDETSLCDDKKIAKEKMERTRRSSMSFSRNSMLKRKRD